MGAVAAAYRATTEDPTRPTQPLPTGGRQPAEVINPSAFYPQVDDEVSALVADPDSKVGEAIDKRVTAATLTESPAGSGFYQIGA